MNRKFGIPEGDTMSISEAVAADHPEMGPATLNGVESLAAFGALTFGAAKIAKGVLEKIRSMVIGKNK